MISLVWGQDLDVASFVRHYIDDLPEMLPGQFKGLGFAKSSDDGQGAELVAGALYFNTSASGSCTEIALASKTPSWCSKQAFGVILGIPFTDKRCFNLVARVEDTNERSRKLLQGVGFRPRGTIHHAIAYRRNLVLYELTRRQWSRGKFHV